MLKDYKIALKKGVDKATVFPMVEEVTLEFVHRPKIFIAKCTVEQYQNLSNPHNEYIASIEENADENEFIQDQAAKSVNTRRNLNYVDLDEDKRPLGNWGLIRHTSATNNLTQHTVENTYTYNTPYEGSGVDIILNVNSVLDLDDPEFKTGGTTRLKQFNWGSLPGMGVLGTTDYSGTGESIDDHAEAVAYIVASNTYGWATAADLYVYPRNQHNLTNYGWDCFKLFHQAKTNNRPTIVIDAINYWKKEYHTNTKALFFRDKKYETINPSGTAEMSPGFMKSGRAGWSFGTMKDGSGAMSRSGFTNILTSKSGYSNSQMAAHLSDITQNNEYTVYIEPIEDMIAAGVHHVSAASNNGESIVLPEHPDYNNSSWTSLGGYDANGLWVQEANPTSYGSAYFTNRPNHCVSGDTIAVGALASEVGYQSIFAGKETLLPISNRGNRVDTCAAGQNIFLDLYTNGKYTASGTSFASSNLGGMAACVLGKYPTTTPRQLRKYFREVAVGNDKLHDTGVEPAVSTEFGDAAYFSDFAGLQGYSGNIAYFDTSLSSNPTTLSNDPITETVELTNNRLDYTTEQINAKLS